MARQIRYSAGTYLELGDCSIMLDPGPGTLTRCATARPGVDPTELDAIVLTHVHIDHSNDLNCLVDAMTEGGFESRGAVFAPGEALEGEDRILLNYLRGFPERIVRLEPDSGYEINGLRFSTTARHEHTAETYGIRFHRPEGDLSFLVDTAYFEELAGMYAGSDVLVINVVRRKPYKKKKILHLTLEEAESVIQEVQPRKAVLTHFGMTMVKARPWQLAEDMSCRLGVEVVAASDGKTLQLNDD
mgnify:CR=1 FL=1